MKVNSATETDIKMVQLAADEIPRKDIATIFEMSNRTIEGKFDEIRKRHKCKTMIGLVVKFYRNKLIK